MCGNKIYMRWMRIPGGIRIFNNIVAINIENRIYI